MFPASRIPHGYSALRPRCTRSLLAVLVVVLLQTYRPSSPPSAAVVDQQIVSSVWVSRSAVGCPVGGLPFDHDVRGGVLVSYLVPGTWYRVSALTYNTICTVTRVGRQVLMVHKAFLKRKRPLYSKRQEAIAEVPDFWLKVVSQKQGCVLPVPVRKRFSNPHHEVLEIIAVLEYLAKPPPKNRLDTSV